jgi:hypothetical protein
MVLDLHVGFLQVVHGMIGGGTLLSVRNFFLSGFLEKDYFRKRKQLLDLDKNPSVHITYHHLTRESKKRLQEAVRQWAEWHGRHYVTDSSKEAVESGDEQYFPALQIGPTNSISSVSFWLDRPSKQARTQQAEGAMLDTMTSNQERDTEVPLYDRAIPSALSSQDSRDDGYIELAPEEAARCFNCGSYSHGLKDCHRPRDTVAISFARRTHALRKGLQSVPRSASRYYQTTPGGKFEKLKPGVLGTETRQLLGIGENDPPPWLHRMRELGYPPGYLVTEDEASGLEILGFDMDKEKQTEDIGAEEGEIVDYLEPVAREPSPAKKLAVEFPGINAPIPENADERLWRQPLLIHSSQHERGNWYHHSISVQGVSPNESAVPGSSLARLRSYRDPEVTWNEYQETETSDDAPPGTVSSKPKVVPRSGKWTADGDGGHTTDLVFNEDTSLLGTPRIEGDYIRDRSTPYLDPPMGLSLTSPSQVSPTGSGYGEDFQPSPSQDIPSPIRVTRCSSLTYVPLEGRQLCENVHSMSCSQQSCQASEIGFETPPNDAWAQAQAALVALHSTQTSEATTESHSEGN